MGDNILDRHRKSRFLRAVFTKKINSIDIGYDLEEKLKATIKNNPYHYHYHSYDDEDNSKILSQLDSAPLESGLREWVYSKVEGVSFDFSGVFSDEINNVKSKGLEPNFDEELSEVTRLCPPILKLLEQKKYIPTLRGLRPLDPQKDLYIERTVKDYFEDKGKDPEIFTGYSLYSDLMHSLLGLEEERESIRRFENYLSEHFFEGKQVTLIPKKDRDGAKKPNDVVYVKVGDEAMRPIYELGDGIQAIIILTVRPFLNQEPTTFFIEEPEQHLHAGMQRALIQAFRACPQHKYFFTTQSNHFIDLSLESDDISLFGVKKVLDKEGTSKSEVTNQKDRSAILKDLGVLASSVLLANCSIWVEGVTDKLYLRVYLQRFEL